MNSHYDDYCDYTLVCYLNDDYFGGETVVENMTYYPKSGKMILFNSSKNKHSVNTIIGNRYTYISWWKSNGLS